MYKEDIRPQIEITELAIIIHLAVSEAIQEKHWDRQSKIIKMVI